MRHYFLRQGPNVADIQVNLVDKSERAAQSHDIAKRIRPRVKEIADRYGASVKIAEVPPGPPVLQTLVAEIYGPDYATQIEAAARVREIFSTTDGVVDVDWYVESPQTRLRLAIEHDKGGARRHIGRPDRADGNDAPRGNGRVGLLHDPREAEDVDIQVRLPLATRASVDDLLAVQIAGEGGAMVPLGELVRVEETLSSRRSITRISSVSCTSPPTSAAPRRVRSTPS